jgi:hypothetical protein
MRLMIDVQSSTKRTHYQTVRSAALSLAARPAISQTSILFRSWFRAGTAVTTLLCSHSLSTNLHLATEDANG